MAKIKSYGIVSVATIGELESEVYAMIGENWQPFGPPVYNPTIERLAWLQVMVVYEDEDDAE